MNSITVIGKVSKEQKDVTTSKGSTFTAFTIEDRNSFSQYPDYVKVTVWGTLRDKISEVQVGAIVAVTGRASCEGYLGQRDQKPKGVITVNAREIEVVGVSHAKPEAAPAKPKATGKPAPALVDDPDSDIPF